MFLELYDALGPAKIRTIAEIYAKDPFKFRAGWPDITMWRKGEVRFIEVKAPGDKVHASQRNIIEAILKPLSLNVAIAKVRECKSV